MFLSHHKLAVVFVDFATAVICGEIVLLRVINIAISIMISHTAPSVCQHASFHGVWGGEERETQKLSEGQ
jgi:hypothetical protein